MGLLPIAQFGVCVVSRRISAVHHPTLWRVFSYSGPGLPMARMIQGLVSLLGFGARDFGSAKRLVKRSNGLGLRDIGWCVEIRAPLRVASLHASPSLREGEERHFGHRSCAVVSTVVSERSGM